MKLVSIIVPINNKIDRLVKCYNSLINQSYKNIEIIFVYDSNINNILDVLNSFKDDRVKIINKKSNRFFNNRKLGLMKSKGEYICFVDSNSTLSKNYISRLVRIIEKDNTNIAISRLVFYYCYPSFRKVISKSKTKPRRIDLNKKREYLPILTSKIVGKLFKREYLEGIDLNDNVDFALMYSLYIESRYISFDNKAIYHYNLIKDIQSNEYLYEYSLNNLINTFEFLRLIYEEFKTNNKLEENFYEIEMVFIKNISKIIYNVLHCIDDKIYRYKFVSAILDYLEYFFPDWDSNPYYIRGFKLGEVNDKFYLMKMRNIVSQIKRKKVYIDLDTVYDRYKKIETMYEKIKQ